MEMLTLPSTQPRPHHGHLDILLDEVCIALQLTRTQYESAEGKYHAVAGWLSAPGSPLAHLRPHVYPQGSVALQTTVKPRRDQRDEEFDVDSVLELAGWRGGPMALYEATYSRLAAHSFYAEILEPKKRCIRLNYAGEFHLDVLPAVRDLRRGGTCILIPDRELHDWSSSNPRGFAGWFKKAAEVPIRVEERMAADPLPNNDPAERRAPLKRAVQLLKRRRDVIFNGSGLAPKSVVLTTLAAEHYSGQLGVTESLLEVLDGIAHQIESTPGIIQILNPTNPGELFSDAWDERSFRAFADFVVRFREEVRRVASTSGLHELRVLLASMFGEEPTTRAMKALAARVEGARDRQVLSVKPGVGLTVMSTGARPVPRNTFYGS